MKTNQPLGVGIIGGGLVTQAIHLPTLARMPDLFNVTAVMDVDPKTAEAVAKRAHARAVTSVEDLLEDTSVEVVAVCSPHQFHAAQAIAAMEAGKKAVLCEKPYATTHEEAKAISAASVRTGVPVLVGAMHVFDPAWAAASRNWKDLVSKAHAIRSSIFLPSNDRFEDWATEVVGRTEEQTGLGPRTREATAEMFHRFMLGLAVHDLPLVRTFLPDAASLQVHTARPLGTFGYLIEASAGDRSLHMTGGFHGHWDTRWEFEVIADDDVLHLEFTPSYIHGGSAVATLKRADGSSRTWGPYRYNGYEGEWHLIHAAASGKASTIPTQSNLIDDLNVTLALAERSATRAAEEFQS